MKYFFSFILEINSQSFCILFFRQVLEQRARVDQLSFQLRKSENFTKEKESEISVLNKYIQNLATTKMELSKENERLEEESMRREEEGKIMEEEGKRRREEIEDLELEIKGLKEIKVRIVYYTYFFFGFGLIK